MKKVLMSFLAVCCWAMTANAQKANLPTDSVPPVKTVSHSMADDSVLIDGDVVYTVADPIARFKGGNEKLSNFLQSNLSISKAHPKENHGNGRVLVLFYVAKDGAVKNVHIMKGLSPEIDMEAMRVVRMMPNWIPAQRKGQSVCMKMAIPITFRW